MTEKDRALTLATKAHEGQVDKAGTPYIEHLLAVAANFPEDDPRHVVALLHDIVEDTETTLDDLRDGGFSEEIVTAVDCLTKRKGVPYDEYVARIKANPVARDVKVADLRHNSQLSRLKEITSKDLARCKKYEQALAFLTN